MQKPDFDNLNNLINALERTDGAFDRIFNEREKQKAGIKAICKRISIAHAKYELNKVSVDELKNSKAGIRVAVLVEGGYKTLGDLARAKDYDLEALDGIGEKQVEAIRHILAEFANSIAARYNVKLDNYKDGKLHGDTALLVTQLYCYMKCEQVRKDALEPVKILKSITAKLDDEDVVTNGFRWIFASKDAKVKTCNVSDEIYRFCTGPDFKKLMKLLELYDAALKASAQAAEEEFKKSGADYYALLESIDGGESKKPFIYDYIPVKLAEEIEKTALKLDGFKGNLRHYQTFGAKYIIHQKNVLLGDEMGLGKTIQAIAAMEHINETREGKKYFLVICPASVLINWAREIVKFSSLIPHILHGKSLEERFDRWIEKGGAAITNYESIGKIVGRIDNHLALSMLVVDEAHYMKNPDAQRTKYIRRLDDESESIVMMTGTPLENRVEEMCSLIEFIKPDMVGTITEMAKKSHLPEFREMLAPVYLRRLRKQVLTELPSIEENEEWCYMTPADRVAYEKVVMARNFNDMRKVSFIQEDSLNSSKMIRLLELCDMARDEGRKVIIFSYFTETIHKVRDVLGEECAGVIEGDTKVESRQGIIDKFSSGENGNVMICQIQSGGVGLNIQAASIVIFCEPQIKPSLTWQALSRVYRMGQVRNVLIYHLLCDGTVDEKIMNIFKTKEMEFNKFANESVVADAYDNIMDKDWISKIVEEENKKYLPTAE